MRSILDLTSEELKKFLLKSESYATFDLPPYINFDQILNNVDDEIALSFHFDENITELFNNTIPEKNTPKRCSEVNYKIFINKDGKYDWRPLELIHPVLYVWMVNVVAKEDNLATIKDRFKTFESNNLIECMSIPVSSDSEYYKDKAAQISSWVKRVEEKSLELGLDYDYFLQTDIANCYASIYTHSIPWALYTKEEAKQMRDRKLLGNQLDELVQSMCYGQTNGIPQGSTLMDLLAELVIGYVDELFTARMSQYSTVNFVHQDDYKIIRYRDDYRIFSNNPELIQQIAKLLSESLLEVGLKLSAQKTSLVANVLTSSVKEDKLEWVVSTKNYDNLFHELQAIHIFSEKYPQSGTLMKLLTVFQDHIALTTELSDNIPVMISYVVDIAYHNPRTHCISMAILSKIFTYLDTEQVNIFVDKIKKKFSKIPNTGFIEIWLQRALLQTNARESFTEPLCRVVCGEPVNIWNSEWLSPDLTECVEPLNMINQNIIDALPEAIEPEEIRLYSSHSL